MGKVIDIVTRKEITEMPATIEAGEALIENLLRFESWGSRAISVPQTLVDGLITMVENNSGASRYDVMNRIYAERKV